MSNPNSQTPQLPLWHELPNFSLHLDQVIDITNTYVEPIVGERLTKTMMHNYFKSGVLVSPQGKLYGQIQLAGAIIVDLLKKIFTLSEISAGLKIMLKDTSPQTAYDTFVNIFNEQASRESLSSKALTNLDIETATPIIQMEYAAVESILFWLDSRKILYDNIDAEV
ncbi:DUF1836 domain-containing protein [Lentilactobacillus kosonis]|uniref:DUF1836 domain-containing protein n=1 Tax=Lentilactobacillus kosonis TaxID=2810561 RepID=A0A401FLZ8_9LACO|nr:DUF1836 domain-containing protein [Lentilactobacillus kosonis]GAY73336.1 hypothetical protein NBRC111893_1482 [Lentilactobacillus kosonis]